MLKVLKISPLTFLFIPSMIIAALAITVNLSASIRLDEAQSVWVATKSVSGIITNIAQDVHVPLYPLLLHFWIQLYGTNVFGLRLLSFVFFVLSIPFLYLMAYRTGGGRVALITISLFCLSPFLTWYSTETRMYTLLTFFSILSHITFLTVFRSQGKAGKALYFLTSVLGLYSHYFFGIILFLQFLYFSYHVVLKKGAIFKRTADPAQLESLPVSRWRSYGKYLLILLLIGISFLPWIALMYMEGGAANTKPLLLPPTSYNLLQLFVHFFTGFQSPTVQSSLISLWPLCVILFFFSFSRKKKLTFLYTDYFILVTFAPIVIAVLVSFTFQPILVSRYLIFITPTLFYLLSVLLVHFNKTLFWSFIGVLFLSNFYFQTQQALSREIEERENYEAVAQYLTTHTTARDVIVVSAPFTVYPIEFHYRGDAKIETIPNWNRYESGSIPPFSVEGLDAQVEQYKSQYQRLFLVLSYDQGYEEEVRQYFDYSLHMNTHLIFSPGLQMREYQLRYD